MTLTAKLVAAHDAATSGKTYGTGAGQTNCSIALEDILARVYGEQVRDEHAALMIFDASQPFSPVDAVVRLGIAEHVDEPQPGRWHVVQGWADIPTSGHSFLYWHSMYYRLGSPGQVLEANVARPWNYETAWAERTERYVAGVRLAALIPPGGADAPRVRMPTPGGDMPSEKAAKPAKKATEKRRRKKAAKTNPFANIAAKAFPKLNPKQLNRAARRLVLAVAEKDGTGEEKHATAAAELAKQLDVLLVWPDTPAGKIAEAVDGPSLQLLASFIVKHAHDALKSEGKIK